MLFDMCLKINSLSFLKYFYVFPETTLEVDFSKVKKQRNPHILYEIISQFRSKICLFYIEFATKMCKTGQWLFFLKFVDYASEPKVDYCGYDPNDKTNEVFMTYNKHD